MADSPDSPVDEPHPETEVDPAVPSGPPPLRIHHFLAVTVVAAVLLSISHVVQHGEATAIMARSNAPMGFVATIATAAALTLVLFGFCWRHEGRSFFDQPGHWLLLEMSLGTGGFVLAALAAATHHSSEYALVGAWSLTTRILVFCVSFSAAFRVADTISWRTYFLVAGTATLAPPWIARVVGVQSYMTVWSVIAIVLFSMLAMAASRDFGASRRRDWPNWIGVMMRLGELAVYLLHFAGQWLVAHGWLG